MPTLKRPGPYLTLIGVCQQKPQANLDLCGHAITEARPSPAQAADAALSHN